jgi:DNA-directed RNA polymerase beta' subunit
MKGVSANIMFGQKPPCGTGLVDILLDETKLPEGVEEEISVFDAEIEDVNQKISANEGPDGVCRTADIVMEW